ncbi:protein unc-45A [Sesamum angolense]|uniref:Protein unc-45A n=1 Tax=Sesamum angolense TaxID=2727404 RepID=A0AAE1W540_9LAMI|nr:protein unc-45A [Sesamum angolense]
MASGSATMSRIERAHQMYREGKYAEALDYYTEALSMAKTKPQKIALHSNRAACYLKLHDFDKEYHSALFDVNRLMELNPSSEVYRNLQARLKTQLNKESKSGNISSITEIVTSQDQSDEKTVVQKSAGWQTIPKPKGHSYLDYSVDRVEMSLVKKKKMMMTMMMVLNLSIDFVLKLLV